MRYARIALLFLWVMALAIPTKAAPMPTPLADGWNILDATETAVWRVELPPEKAEFDGTIGSLWAENPQTARSWNSGEQGDYTNKAQNAVAFTNYAAVAQWIDFKVSDTRKDWRILKPGVWVGKALDLAVRSNDDVEIYFEAFTDLSPEPNPYDDGNVLPVKAWYALTDKSENPPGSMWFPAGEFLSMARQPLFDDYFIRSTQVWPLHWNYREWSLWSLIDVHNCHKPINYRGTGTITIQVTALRDWVDMETGGYGADQPTYNFPPSGQL